MPTRRSVLIGVGVLASSSLAGCNGLMGSDDPEGVVETYITAGNEGDFEKANRIYLHHRQGEFSRINAVTIGYKTRTRPT